MAGPSKIGVNAGEGPAPRGEGGPAAHAMIFPGPAPLRQCPSEIHGTFTEPLPTSAHAAPLARARLRNQIVPCWARAAPRRRLIAAERPDTPVHAVVGMALAVAAPVAAALNGALVARRDLAAGAGSGRRGRTGLTEGTLHVVRVVTFARAPATRVRRGRWKGRGGRVIARLARGVGRALPGDRGTGRKRKGKGECQEEQTGVANTQSHLAVVVVGRESWRASC